MDSSAVMVPAPGPSDAVRWRWMRALLFAVAVTSWWEEALRQGRSLGTAPHVDAAVAAGIMVAARLAASAIEALAYGLWWRARGARLPYAPFFVTLVGLSILDRVAALLAAQADRAPALAVWLTPLVGPRLLRDRLPGVEPGLWVAFGALGLLTLTRIALTARLQATGTGRRLRAALAVTAAAWLATRLALWWSVDLMRGMSPLR